MSLIRQQVASAIDYGALPDRRVMRTHFQKRRFTSFGVMAYCLSTRQWLLVRPSHSYSYTLFVNGMYRKADLEVMLSLMTIDELTILRKLLHGQKEWRDVYHGHFFKETFDLFKHSQSKLRICLSRVAGHPKTAWTFPKGRPENDESVMETAVREFDEETGLHIERIGRLIDRTPISETYTSFDHQIYETVCWLYVIDTPPDDMVLNVGVGGEICERCWVSTETAKAILTPSKFAMIQEALARHTLRSVTASPPLLPAPPSEKRSPCRPSEEMKMEEKK